MPAPANHSTFTRLKKVSRSCASVRRNGSSASKPFGTVKYQVGAISRRLRTVSSIAPGSGLPSSIWSVPPL